MAYEKQTWACGDEITAEKMNHIEDGIASAGGGCDCGFECVESMQTLTEESVTTNPAGNTGLYYGGLNYSQAINSETIRVTFDGTEYECTKHEDPTVRTYYGATPSLNGSQITIDFSEYPFMLTEGNRTINQIMTQTQGAHSIKIEALSSSAETTECFDMAVNKVVFENAIVNSNGIFIAHLKNVNTSHELDCDKQDIINAINDNKFVIVVPPSSDPRTPFYLENASSMSFHTAIYGVEVSGGEQDSLELQKCGFRLSEGTGREVVLYDTTYYTTYIN